MIEGFARCLVEDRQSGKVRHTLKDLLAQRIYGLACGHPDANDADRLPDDPMHKLLLGRDPLDGDALASQPTISRFENRVGRDALYAMGRELAATVIDRHRQRRHGRARRITIDLGPTEDPTHGARTGVLRPRRHRKPDQGTPRRLAIGRTSGGRFWPNQLRVLLTAAACVLMQELRLRAARTACAHAQVTTLRARLLTLGVHVVRSVRRIVLHLPTSTPDLDA